MPKRYNDHNSDEHIPKKSLTAATPNHVNIRTGEVLRDISGKEWILGQQIGLGGFGVIHKVAVGDSLENDKYVVKIEGHSSGPLFTEINCYLRIARENMIEDWKKKNKLSSLGMPNYVASGSHSCGGGKLRFLVLPRYERDLEMILQEKKKFNLKTVILISSQILHILEYIHSKGYIHSDIKAANILLGQMQVQMNSKCSVDTLSAYSKSPIADSRSRYPRLATSKPKKLWDLRSRQVQKSNKRYQTRNLKKINYSEDVCTPEKKSDYKEIPPVQVDQVYLLDFGLASKYKLSSGEHKKYEDERKAHAGTLLFCSRDAHKGIQSRRSDLESLAYNMVYWLTGSLPWIEDLENPEMIQRKKRHCFVDPLGFLYFCMPNPPRILKDFFQSIKNLDVEDTPDYHNCQQLLKKALEDHGYQDGKFDFDNIEGWRLGKKSFIEKPKALIIDEFKRPPLLSNMFIKPVLRKKTNTKKVSPALNWSRMLSNPEVLLKKVRAIETHDPSPAFFNFNIEDTNPTPAMREVYQRYEERRGLSPKGYEEIDTGNFPGGYTSAMVTVWQKIVEQGAMAEAVIPAKRSRKCKSAPKRKKKSNDYVKESSKKSIPFTRTYSLRG